MINKVTLMELFKDTFRRSALISIPDVSDLLEVKESMFTKWEIFYSIVRDALKNFEYHYPLSLVQKIFISVDTKSRKAQINSNFDAFLKGIITEDQVVIMPASINSMSISYYTASTIPLREFRYNPPEITDCWYASGSYYMNCICKRPFPEQYDEVSGLPTDNCAVWYLNKDQDTQYSIFRDEVYLQTCRYYLNLKKNMNLQNLPIELFQGIEEDKNEIQSKLDNIYQQAATHAYWII